MSTAEQTPKQLGHDIRPVVASKATSRTAILFGGVMMVAAGLLFYTLEARRAALRVATSNVPVGTTSYAISSPPPLSLPTAPDTYGLNPSYIATGNNRSGQQPGLDSQDAARDRPAFRGLQSGKYPFTPPLALPDLASGRPNSVPSNATGPQIIYDASPTRSGPAANTSTVAKTDERVTATWFQNPSTTIPKGTVIQAVLESALDSTRAGFARAIVTNDVLGFDGSQILIPRGSRLIGEYKADLTSGQNRALIQWQRLMRPDGAMINLDSPAADPLGRAGVKGKVNSHFFERFSGAILQSTLDIGVQLATRSVSRDAVILALPGSMQGVTQVTPDKVQPTLTVRQGSSVSVFVSRDLDFSTVTE